MHDLDWLLNQVEPLGTGLDDEGIRLYFRDGEFFEESHLVTAIRKHLLTPQQRRILADLNLSIEDILNGRVTGYSEWAVDAIFDEWNVKLGFRHFGV